MFTSLLIANHEALHVRLVDEAVHICGSPAKDSYLSIDKITARERGSIDDVPHGTRHRVVRAVPVKKHDNIPL